jgi:hypothetical protein
MAILWLRPADHPAIFIGVRYSANAVHLTLAERVLSAAGSTLMGIHDQRSDD